ncbi:hypothetical protein [Tissierella sp.]|uniref:hypothetical protein n=1 Tax=Tissierella sp. TaxID=41274 RepID=UPI0028A941FE|nr:hypothetical protein [Tissierella sp.]
MEQKKELKDGIGVIFGLENEFNELEFRILNENLCYLNLYFSNQGSGMSCKMLVQSLKKSLKIVDLYFGNKDGVDTIVTGHHKVKNLIIQSYGMTKNGLMVFLKNLNMNF